MNLLIIFIVGTFLINFLEARDKYIKVEKVTQCVKSENLPIQILTSETNKDFMKHQVILNSTVEIKKRLKGSIQVRFFA